MNRAVVHKRLLNLRRYHAQQHHDAVAQALARQEKQFPIGGILPEEPCNALAHCGQWHAIPRLPWRLSCCGLVIDMPQDLTVTPQGGRR